jgi:hypothetical protein
MQSIHMRHYRTRYPSATLRIVRAKLLPTFIEVAALPTAFVVGADVLALEVVEAVCTTKVEFGSADCVTAPASVVTAPAPSPPPLATGTVVTVEKNMDELTELETVLSAVAIPDAEVAGTDEAEDDEPDGESGELLPSVLMLWNDPDISL